MQHDVPTTWRTIGLQYSRTLRIAPTKVQVSYKDYRLLVIQPDAIVNVRCSYNQLRNWIFTTAFNSTISWSVTSALSRVTRVGAAIAAAIACDGGMVLNALFTASGTH